MADDSPPCTGEQADRDAVLECVGEALEKVYQGGADFGAILQQATAVADALSDRFWIHEPQT